MQLVFLQALEVLLEKDFDLVHVVEVHDHRPDRVADHLDRVVILEDARILREDGRFLRGLDVSLDVHGILFQHVEEFVHQAEKIGIVLLLPLRPCKCRHHVARGMLDRGEVVGCDEGPGGRAADHHHLVRQRVQDDVHPAACHEVAAKHHHDGYSQSDSRVHVLSPSPGALARMSSLKIRQFPGKGLENGRFKFQGALLFPDTHFTKADIDVPVHGLRSQRNPRRVDIRQGD